MAEVVSVAEVVIVLWRWLCGGGCVEVAVWRWLCGGGFVVSGGGSYSDVGSDSIVEVAMWRLFYGGGCIVVELVSD